MKKLKKVGKIILKSLLVLIALAILIPYVFKSKIVAYVKENINNKLNAKVDFKDVSISFFRHFPKVSIGLDEISVIGSASFSGDTLLYAERLDAAVDIMSFIRGKDMNIYSVVAEEPRIHAIVNKEGLANWDIMKPDTATAAGKGSAGSFSMKIDKYQINDAYISYVDVPGNMSAVIDGLDHTGKGDLTSSLFTLATSTKAKEVTYIYNGIPFLSKVATTIDADIQIDNTQNSYTYSTDKITLNDLNITSNGVIKRSGENGYQMDIDLKAPSTDLKKFLSLIPVLYRNDFSSIKTGGEALFNGKIKGLYDDVSMPGYHVNMEVRDGFLQYPDLPKPIKNINFKAMVDNPDGQTDHTVIDISNGHLEMDDMPFDLRLLIKQPVSNLFVDAAAKGKMDLSRIGQFVKLEKETKLSGLLNADVNLKGIVSDIEKQQYDRFSAGGTIALSDFFYASKDEPTGVRIHSLLTSFTPKQVDISTLSGNYLSTNFNGSGQINNLLTYMFKNEPLDADLRISADKLNLNDWLGISTDTTTTGTKAAPFAVPSNLDVTLQASVDKVLYDKTDIDHLTGTLNVKNETIFIDDVKGNALDGTIAVDGQYSTLQSKTKPDIALDYKVTGVDVQKTFYAFNTVQKLMPIGKFIAGKLTSQLSMKGKLGENMMPDMNTLSGFGDLLLIEGFLSKFAPLDKIASTLNIKSLEQISLKDIKNYFEFSNGKVLVKPFKAKIAGIDMEIGGMQGLDQSLNYVIQMNVPRSMMGTQGNQFVNGLISQANSKGVPLKIGETVPLHLSLGGFIKSPTVRTDLKQDASSLADQMKQQMTDFAKAKIDSAKRSVTTAVKDTLNSVKQQVLNSAKKSLLKQLPGNNDTPVDSATKPATPKESLKGLMDNLFRKKQKDTTNKQ